MANAEAWLGIPYAEAQRFARPFRLPWDGDLSRHGALGPSAPQLPSNDIVPGMQVGPTDEAGCLNGERVGARGGRVEAGARLVPRRIVRDRIVGPTLPRRRAGSRPNRTSSSSARTTASARSGSSTRARSVAMSPTSGCTMRSPRSNGSRTTSPRSAVIRRSVTVFGLSAGGGLGIHLLASPAAAGSFAQVIVQSGITDRTLDAERGALVARTLCTALEVDDIEGLAALPVDAILAAQAAVTPQLMKPVGIMPFHPCIDDELLRAAPAAAFAAGVGKDIPLIAGHDLGGDEPLSRSHDCGPTRSPRLACRALCRRRRGNGCRRSSNGTPADVGLDGVWPALFTDVEMQLPLRRVLEARAIPPGVRRRSRICSHGRLRNAAPSTRSTSRSPSTRSTSTAGASSSVVTTTPAVSVANCATPGPSSRALRITRLGSVPRDPRVRSRVLRRTHAPVLRRASRTTGAA